VSRTFRLLLFAIGVAAVTLMVWKAGPATLWAGLRSAIWVAAALFPLWVGVYLCNAMAWRLLTSDGDSRLSLPAAFRISVMAFAVNYSTPLMSFGGEPLRVMAATPVLGRRRAVGSVVAFRLLHALAHVIGFLVALVPAAILLPHTPLVLTCIALTGAALLLIGWFLVSRHREGLAIHLLELLRRLPLIGRLAVRLERHTPALHEIDAHLTAVYTRAPRRFFAALAVEAVGRALTLGEYWVILYGLGLGVDPARAFVVASFSSLVINVLIFLPFELGAKEGGLFFIFQWLGMTPALGIQAALLSRIRELTWIGIGWVLVWTMR
jgi:uncharacterized protein (TIRG00374 family)